MNVPDYDYLKRKCHMTKETSLDLCINAGAGHVTSALSCAEIVTYLYYYRMSIDPLHPDWAERDRFVMSKNHGSVITFPILCDLGYFSEEQMRTYLHNGSPFGRHTKLGVPGADFCGGSLGIGMGVACGMATAAKLDGAQWRVYALVGDGECCEGSVWEAAMFAGAKRLDNLTVIIDRNRLALTDFTENMMPLESLRAKWEAFGWYVAEINGHSFEEIHRAIGGDATNREGLPLAVIANTIKGHGIDFMENQPLWHGQIPKGEKARLAKALLRGGQG